MTVLFGGFRLRSVVRQALSRDFIATTGASDLVLDGPNRSKARWLDRLSTESVFWP